MEVKPKRVSLAPQRTPKARPARVSGGGSAGATARHGSLALGQNDKKLLTVLLGVLAVTTLLLYVFRGSARRQQDTIFVALGAYRDRKCTDTLTDLFRKADRPELISVGAVSFTVPGNTSSSELCEGSQLAPFEPSIRRLALSHLDAKGPFVARSHSASLYGGERYVLQIDSHVVFAPGWDTELLRMLRSLRSPKPLLTTYPAAVTGLDETRVPVLCVAFWRQPSGLLRLGTVLEPQPYRNQYKPVPFATGGLMFARADVLAEVPYDPTLEYLFHGDDALYSARLWTSGWDFYTPDRNVVFHSGGSERGLDLPAFLADAGRGAGVAERKRESEEKALAILTGRYDPSYPFGMGSVRPLSDWWEYAGLDPADHTVNADGSRFCMTRRRAGPQSRHGGLARRFSLRNGVLQHASPPPPRKRHHKVRAHKAIALAVVYLSPPPAAAKASHAEAADGVDSRAESTEVAHVKALPAHAGATDAVASADGLTASHVVTSHAKAVDASLASHASHSKAAGATESAAHAAHATSAVKEAEGGKEQRVAAATEAKHTGAKEKVKEKEHEAEKPHASTSGGGGGGGGTARGHHASVEGARAVSDMQKAAAGAAAGAEGGAAAEGAAGREHHASPSPRPEDRHHSLTPKAEEHHSSSPSSSATTTAADAAKLASPRHKAEPSPSPGAGVRHRVKIEPEKTERR